MKKKISGAFCFPTHRPNALHYNTFSKVYAKSVCIDFLFLTNLRLRSVCSSQPIQISRIYSIWYPCPNASSLHTIAEDDRLVANPQKQHEDRSILKECLLHL